MTVEKQATAPDGIQGMTLSDFSNTHADIGVFSVMFQPMIDY